MTGGPKENISSASEYVTEIERRIRVAYKRVRYIRHSLPFNKVTKIFLIHLVFQTIKILNHFTVKGGIYGIISPTTTMTGKSINLKKNQYTDGTIM